MGRGQWARKGGRAWTRGRKERGVTPSLGLPCSSGKVSARLMASPEGRGPWRVSLLAEMAGPCTSAVLGHRLPRRHAASARKSRQALRSPQLEAPAALTRCGGEIRAIHPHGLLPRGVNFVCFFQKDLVFIKHLRTQDSTSTKR